MDHTNEVFFAETDEVFLVPVESGDTELRAVFDYEIERCKYENSRVIDHDWRFIDITVGHRWGDHYTFSFNQIEELDAFTKFIVDFNEKAKEAWNRADFAKPEGFGGTK